MAWPRGTSGPAYRLLGHPVQPSLVQEQGLWKSPPAGETWVRGSRNPSCRELRGPDGELPPRTEPVVRPARGWLLPGLRQRHVPDALSASTLTCVSPCCSVTPRRGAGMERGRCSGSARAPSPQRPFPFVSTSEMHSPPFVCVPESCDLGKLLGKLLTQLLLAPESVLSSLSS